MKEQYERTRRLVLLLIETVRECYPRDDEGSESFVRILHCYADELARLSNWCPTDVTYLRRLKQTVSDAGEMMATLAEEKPDLLRGWFHGAEPRNMTQRVCGVLSDAALRMSWSIAGLEAEHGQN